MPEGPECKATAHSIDGFMCGKRISNVEILSGRYTKKPPPGFEKFKSMMPAHCIGWIAKGKFIYGMFGEIEGPHFFIWNTLGMSGYWSFSPKNILELDLILKAAHLSGTQIQETLELLSLQ